ncbi:MAG TPA: glycoside hydrolase family 38 C-terminal domain-containing protein [Trebonia sp.]|jgi:alpha-mannosidase|nr:glycoside hydrolase family 38 C-terminal domain-containing protein [Trebonia sp.]
MRITGVESTDLFTGSTGRPLQVIVVTVEGGPGGSGGVSVRVAGPGVESPGPAGAGEIPPGEARAVEVAVRVADHHRAGTSVPVTVIAQAAQSAGGQVRASREAMITVAEPGWTTWMVSHFHYDPVWWSTQGQFTEARLVLPDEDGSLPDTRTAFDLVRLHLEKARRDPDYKFVLAEVDYLKPHFDAFPEDRAFVRSLLGDGRLELVGGTYNEPNTNLTGAEVTIRNAVYGMGFQRGVLGGEVGSAWMLDSFGHDPGFPGLMAQAGLTSSAWARGPFHQWGPDPNERMQFPAEFEWLSPDGTGVLTAYMANHYGAGWALHTAKTLAEAQAAALTQFRSLAPVAATRNVMLPVGADHVIPARWVTDLHRSWRERYVWPRFVTAVPRDFFAAVRAEAAAEPGPAPGGRRRGITPQTRDMNPLYTGKDVSYIDTKQAHRAGETATSEGERLATLAWLRGARRYPAESLDKAWRQLAYGAHHDALTGTESDQVYLDLLAGWREAWERGDEARRESASALAGAGGDATGGLGVTVFNGLARERAGMATVTVRLDEPGTPWLALTDPGDGTEVPALADGITRHPDGSLAQVTLTFRARRLPALGFRRYGLRPAAAPAEPGWTGIPGEAGPAAGSVTETTAMEGTAIECTVIENEALAVTADPARGGTLAITDKRSGRPVLAGPGNEMILQEEYDKHPRWGEGAWHLSPAGPGTGSASSPARVRAQRSPLGQRLLASFRLGDLDITQETLLWDGASRVEFRTHVGGSIGQDHLLRVRFPARVPGGLPVYQTATAVIGRPLGVPEADTAQHWWTLDNPAHHWFGVGSVAKVALVRPGRPDVAAQAIGVAEVITPDPADAVPGNTVPGNAVPAAAVRGLLTALAGAGVTATSAHATGPRYGSVDIDSNLPDFRIAVGGPEDNAFSAEVLAAADPAVAKRLATVLAEQGTARLWVPATRPRADAFGPGADLRGPRDLPVLIVAAAPGRLPAATGELRADLRAGGLMALVELPADAPWPPDTLTDGTVALFNRGTPGGVVAPDGSLWMSLMRACSSWPSGVWIDGDRRTVPDGSSFAWQHWSHTFAYALAFTAGDWREAGFNAAAEDYNHDLIAIAGRGPAGPAGEAGAAAAEGVPLLAVSPASVALLALKPRGNPLAAGLPGTLPADGEFTLRLRETDGKRTVAWVELAGGIATAHQVDLLEEATGAPLALAGGAAQVELPPFGTVTVAIRPAAWAQSPSAPLAGDTMSPAGPPASPAGLLVSEDAEPVQPVPARYWLHGKGPAPVGNVPVAVHFSPTRVSLRETALEGFGPPAGVAADSGRLRLSVAAGPAGGQGDVELLVPEGVSAEVDGASAAGTTRLPYRLGPGEFATWDVTVRALSAPQSGESTPPGRYFLAARIRDGLGQVLEETALVTVGEAGPPTPDGDPMESFFLVQADVMALAGEAGLELLTPALTLAPAESGPVILRVDNHLGCELRGEVQLLSPFGSWEAVPSWVAPVRAEAGSSATVSFPVTMPATAAPGWESWLLVKLMYFGRVRYSEAIRLAVAGSGR